MRGRGYTYSWIHFIVQQKIAQYCQANYIPIRKKRKQIKIHKYLKITMGINDFREKMNLTFDN